MAAIRSLRTATEECRGDGMSRPREKRFSIDDAFEEEQSSPSGPQTHPPARTYKCADDTASKDSDSLIHECAGATPTEACCWEHPKVKENWKTVTCAVALLLLGAALLVGSALLFFSTRYSGKIGAVFLFAGLILFLPGAYHVVYIWLAARGRRGYDFYHLPLFTR